MEANVKVGRLAAALLGLASVGPLAFFAAAVLYVMPRLTSYDKPGGVARDEFYALFDRALRLGGIAIVLSLILYLVFLALIQRIDGISEEDRTKWTRILNLGNLFAMPLVWYSCVWKPGVSSRGH